jgi:dihydroorotase
VRPILIRGGRIIDPSRNTDEVSDLILADGRVQAAGHDLGHPDDALVLDASGKIVAPGLIDVHVHLREPGQEDIETVATGAMAAAAGGFSAVCAMPNTDPVTDNQAAVGFIVSQAQRAAKARVYPIGAVSLGQKGQQLAEFGELVGAGAVAVSDDGKPVASSHMMRTALEYARTFGIPVADHCEEPTLAAGGAMHEGIVSTRLGLKGIPAAAEEIMVARDILLSELTGGHVHLCHMSTRGSVELIRRAKEKGLRVTAEACPHHFTLTHEACEGYNTNAKMNPPLREPEDREAIRQAIRDGTIDVICTDHAPHHYDAKEREFDDAPNGIIGLETALGLALSELVAPGLL